MERCPSSPFFSGLGPTMKDAVTTKLAFEMLSGSSACVRGVAVLADKPFGVCAVHLFHEVALSFRCHGCFADSQHVANSAKVLGQVHIADFVWLNAQVRVVHR